MLLNHTIKGKLPVMANAKVSATIEHFHEVGRTCKKKIAGRCTRRFASPKIAARGPCR
jgi:hypothetical protein